MIETSSWKHNLSSVLYVEKAGIKDLVAQGRIFSENRSHGSRPGDVQMNVNLNLRVKI